MADMATGTLRLKGRELLEKHKLSMYRLAKDGDISYPTIHRYVTTPDEVQYISLDVLYSVLVNGLGQTPEQAADMRFGDVFDFVPAGNGAPE